MTFLTNDVLVRSIKTIQQAVTDGKLTDSAEGNIKQWLTEPHYEKYALGIVQLIEEADFKQLDRLFWEIIPFGTGGRRGLMSQFGSATMNPRTIAESAHGLAVHLKSVETDHSQLKGVVACDTRNRSQEFAQLTATTMAAHGLQVFYFETFRSTPLLSFAVRHLNCNVGVMITASHNPPSDNGFKAYWSTGGQVLEPHDQGIIDAVYEAGEIPTIDFDEAVAQGKIVIVGDKIDTAYINAVVEMSLSAERNISAVFTPLHGVGETSLYAVLMQAGFESVTVLESQRTPDGNFTNVPDQLPNPERTEVYAPAMEEAKQTGAEIILASDPDADRLGVCVKDYKGEFVHLTGNQVGALILDYIVRKRTETGTLSPEHFVVETLVTTPLVAAIAKANNLKIVDDLLVGFKYIGQTMDALGADKFVFGTEESLGYLAGEYARDKCASIAALYLLEAAAELQTLKKTLLDRLDEIYLQHGFFQEGQQSKYCHGSKGHQQIQQLMQAFRSNPPTELAGISFTRVRDYGTHEIRQLPENRPIQNIPQPQGDLIFLESATGEWECQIAIRPSGTEPKIKFYFFAKADCSTGAKALETIKQNSAIQFEKLRIALSTWVENVLK
ncbi:Phosphomannomutase [hydrothermal vent metagenome]|uniref:Phosphomannomutase n=1 Tax=hydrothermal vent metagenome TaxID=652676 RepID=A0A3B1D929_9ZZZZ